jgi:hypothetical protein
MYTRIKHGSCRGRCHLRVVVSDIWDDLYSSIQFEFQSLFRVLGNTKEVFTTNQSVFPLHLSRWCTRLRRRSQMSQVDTSPLLASLDGDSFV